MMPLDVSQRISVFSGMVLVLMMQIESNEVMKTVVLAAIGGVTSFLVTSLVKFLLRRFRRKQNE